MARIAAVTHGFAYSSNRWRLGSRQVAHPVIQRGRKKAGALDAMRRLQRQSHLGTLAYHDMRRHFAQACCTPVAALRRAIPFSFIYVQHTVYAGAWRNGGAVAGARRSSKPRPEPEGPLLVISATLGRRALACEDLRRPHYRGAIDIATHGKDRRT